MHSAYRPNGKENMSKTKKPFGLYNQLQNMRLDYLSTTLFPSPFEELFKVTKRSKNAVVWCVENGPFHKYIKKLRKQRRKNGCK